MQIEFEMSYGLNNSLLGIHTIDGFVIDDNDIQRPAGILSIGFIFVIFSFIFIK